VEEQEIFLFSTPSRPALGPAQPPVFLVPGAPPWVKQLGHEANHSLPSIAEVKMPGGIPPLPHKFHGILN
jgi:hypothetical protein